jgi:hypothetical protein
MARRRKELVIETMPHSVVDFGIRRREETKRLRRFCHMMERVGPRMAALRHRRAVQRKVRLS